MEDNGGQGRGPEGRGKGRKGKGEGERRDRGKGREGKENGHRPPTIFGLNVALYILVDRSTLDANSHHGRKTDGVVDVN